MNNTLRILREQNDYSQAKEQLKVMEKLAGMVQKAMEEKLKPNKQLHSSFYEELNKLNEKYHPNSHGAKWTREELYKR